MSRNSDSPKNSPKMFQEEQEPGPSIPTAPLQQQLTLPLTPSTPLTPTAPSPLDTPGTNECVVCMEDRVRTQYFLIYSSNGEMHNISA